MSDHAEHPVDFLPELALGVLPPAEAERLRAVMAGCEECRTEYEIIASAVEMLPAAADESAPGSHVRAAVLQRIADEESPGEPVAFTARARRRSFLPWAGAAAAGIAVLAAAFGGYALRGEGDSSSGREQAVVEAAGRGDLLVARSETDGMSTTLVRVPGHSEGFVWVENLPALPEGKAYQAWFTRDFEDFEPSGVFSTAEGGTWLAAGGSLDDYLAMGLTVEDEDGAEEPSSAPFVVIELQKSARASSLPAAIADSIAE